MEAARRKQMAQITRALTDEELAQLNRIMEKLVAASEWARAGGAREPEAARVCSPAAPLAARKR